MGLKDGVVVQINGVDFEYSAFYERLNAIAKPNHLACPKCHNTKFGISYGDYECIASCDCGHTMTIYDG